MNIKNKTTIELQIGICLFWQEKPQGKTFFYSH